MISRRLECKHRDALIVIDVFYLGVGTDFESDNVRYRDYIEPKVPYIPMRTMCGLMGVAVVPIAFYTVRNSGHSLHAASLAALLVLFGKSCVHFTLDTMPAFRCKGSLKTLSYY